jgi:choline kinase
MKAILLAAGEGKRLKKYTSDLPKGMLSVFGKTLIQRLIENFLSIGINDIGLVKGFSGEKITYPDIKYFENKEFSKTNMVASLYQAKSFFDQDSVIISYTDVVCELTVLERLRNCPGDIVCVVDRNWQKYWKKRYGKIDFDCESLKLNDDGTINKLGQNTTDLTLIDARIVGLYKFSEKGIKNFLDTWDKFSIDFWNLPWQVSQHTFANAYMTDLIQSFIDQGLRVDTLQIEGGWLEFDTNEDLENAIEWYKDRSINELIKLT